MSNAFTDVTTADGTIRCWTTLPPNGSGPGLILLPEIFGLNEFMLDMAEKFAAEGYVCFVPDVFWRQQSGTALSYDQYDEAITLRQGFDLEQGVEDLAAVVTALREHPAQSGKIGAVGFCMGGLLSVLTGARHGLDCIVSYYGTNLEQHADTLTQLDCPAVLHLGEADHLVDGEAQATITAAAEKNVQVTAFGYPECGHAFASPSRETFDKPATMMAWSRTLKLLRECMGPIYDLSVLWDKHTEYEFGLRDVDATMTTMVDQPYVNHVPTMTGGVGHDHLKRFYKYHFVNSNPPDTRLIPVSRTIGSDRVVDEMLFCFTHTCEIPWMLPGIEPTGNYVEIPLVAIVNFRGDKLYHEHIYWDQASVLVQIGKLDPTGLPVAGIETARKLLDETLPSNDLMASWDTSEGKPL